MLKLPWLQKVEIRICEECYHHLFYGDPFITEGKEEKYYQNNPDPENPENLVTFDTTFDDGFTNHTNIPATVRLFQCDFCETLKEQKEHVFSGTRIMNPDKFEDFLDTAKGANHEKS